MLLHALFHVLQMETSFLFKLFTRVKQICHCQEALRQKCLWIIVVLPWFCLTIVGETDIHVNNFWKWIWFVIFNRIRNNSIYSMTKDGVVHWLLECPLIIQISRLDETKAPQHLSFICACKLHIQIVALWCYFAMAFKVCIHYLLQNMVKK